MTEEEHICAAMNATAPFSYALEEFTSSLGWKPIRMGTIGGSGMSWNLWLPEQTLPPVTMLVLSGQDIQTFYKHRQAAFNLADPKCFDKMEKHLAKLMHATRVVINKRTANLRSL